MVMFLNTGAHKTIDLPFGADEKLMVLGISKTKAL